MERENHKLSTSKREKIFFQKQKKDDGYCRLYAINNALGRAALSMAKFEKFCDQFDYENNTKGSRQFFFIDSELNLISFVLSKFRIDSKYYPPGEASEVWDCMPEDCSAFLAFSSSHIWAHHKYGNTWYCLDSLESKPSTLKPSKLNRGFGYIFLLPQKKQTSKKQESKNETASNSLLTESMQQPKSEE